MFSLEDQIDVYADTQFNAEQHAQFFFSTHAETDVPRQLNELAGVQNQIESILRKKVRQNYGLFLEASDGIATVGNDMTSLKELILKTQTLIENIRKNRSTSNMKLQQNSMLHSANSIADDDSSSGHQNAAGHGFMHQQKGYKNKSKGKDEMPVVPAWVLRAPEDLSRFIIEQRFSQAAGLAVTTKAYVESVRGMIDVSPRSVMADVIKKVDAREKTLAHTILKSLSKLPNSPLWGAEEQQARLRLLISLKYYDLAADGFVKCHTDVIPRTIRNVEASGEVMEYITDLSRAFFTALTTSCKTFLELFQTVELQQQQASAQQQQHAAAMPSNAKRSSMAAGAMNTFRSAPIASVRPTDDAMRVMLSMLVHWCHDQMELFSVALSRQVQLGVSDRNILIIEHFRNLCDSLEMTNHLSTGASHANSASTSSAKMSKQFSGNSGKFAKQRRASITAGDANEIKRAKQILSARSAHKTLDGPLQFVAMCISVAYQDAISIMDQQLNMQGAASLSWLILPDVRKWVNCFADEIIKEICVQVKQEEWFEVHNTPIDIKMPVIGAENKLRTESDNIEDESNSSLSRQSSRTVPLESDGNVGVGIVVETDPGGVSLSYAWMVMILSKFIDESWLLLNYAAITEAKKTEETSLPLNREIGSERNNGSKKQSTPPSVSESYTRSDLCEIEPSIVSSIFRILVNYVRNIEQVDVKALTKAQKDCYVVTLEKVVSVLFPNVVEIVTRCFYYEGLQHSPEGVIDILTESVDNLKMRITRSIPGIGSDSDTASNQRSW